MGLYKLRENFAKFISNIIYKILFLPSPTENYKSCEKNSNNFRFW